LNVYIPASINSSVSVTTSSPSGLKTFNATLPDCGNVKLIVVVGLNGFG
jgi:hypothetical protein